MGTGPWRIYHSAKRRLMTGDIDVDTDSFFISLYTHNSNADDLTLLKIIDVTNQVAGGTGYTTGGQAMTGIIWDMGDDPSEMRFSANPSTWTASGGDIVDVRYAVVWVATKQWLLAVVDLDENGPFNVASGNPLIIAHNNQGIFELK